MLVFLVLTTQAAHADQVLREFAGTDFLPVIDQQAAERKHPSTAPENPLDLGVNLSWGPGSIEFIVNATAKDSLPRQIRLLEMDQPPITETDYAITGLVSYRGLNHDDLEGMAYLQMWSDFADGSHYFTRTFAFDGLLQRFSGKSALRPFRLPYSARPGQTPTHLKLELIMFGRGVIEFSDVKLVQSEGNIAMTAMTSIEPSNSFWFHDGIAAAAAGFLASLGFAGLMELLARRGKARRLVVSLLVAMVLLGQCYFAWAWAVIGHGERWRIYLPLLLTAAMAFLIPVLTLPRIKRRYQSAELRRIEALDAV